MRDDGNIIVLDIETRPDPAIAEDVTWWAKQMESIEPHGSIKDPIKQEAYRQEQLDKKRAKMALSPLTGIVVCVGWQFWADEEASVLETKEQTRSGEKDLLERFAAAMRSEDPTLWVGWYLRRFDLPFLAARCMVVNAEIPHLPMPRNWQRVVDLAQDLDLEGSLSQWQYVLGGGFKEHDGEELAGLTIPELAEHCRQDVTYTAEMARRTRFVWGAR